MSTHPAGTVIGFKIVWQTSEVVSFFS
eukprot:SAG11_NODE_47764_length_127_cov_95.678571_1_plen_26_part_10